MGVQLDAGGGKGDVKPNINVTPLVDVVLVLVVAIWAWSVTGTVVSLLGAIVPAPLRAVTVDLLAKAQDAITRADHNSP